MKTVVHRMPCVQYLIIHARFAQFIWKGPKPCLMIWVKCGSLSNYLVTFLNRHLWKYSQCTAPSDRSCTHLRFLCKVFIRWCTVEDTPGRIHLASAHVRERAQFPTTCLTSLSIINHDCAQGQKCECSTLNSGTVLVWNLHLRAMRQILKLKLDWTQNPPNLYVWRLRLARAYACLPRNFMLLLSLYGDIKRPVHALLRLIVFGDVLYRRSSNSADVSASLHSMSRRTEAHRSHTEI